MLLSSCIQEFIDDRKYRNLSTKTIDGYEIVLDLFKKYCVDHQIVNVDEVTNTTIKSFLLYLQNERSNKPTSTNSKLRTIKTFFNYLVESEIIDTKNNPCKRVMFAREDINIEPFTDEQVKQILGYFKRKRQRERSFVSIRNYVMIVFLLGTGVRLGELIGLKWSDIDIVNGSASILGKKRELSSVPLSEKLIKELAEYKVFAEQYFKNPFYVFPTGRNTQLQPDSVKTIFKRLKEILGFPNRISCHSFRHTFAVMCIRNGMDAFTLQRCLRHTELSMTNRYIRMFGTALKSQSEKFNPLNHMDI